MKLQVSPAFSRRIVAGNGISVTYANAAYTIASTAANAGDPAPIVLLATGQSNVTNSPAAAVVWPTNLHVWNFDGVTGHIGTAFTAADPTKMNVMWQFAAEVARAHPDQQVYLIVVGFAATAISHWLAGTGSPDVFADIVANTVPALVAAGATQIDALLWWQAESDAANTGTMITWFSSFATVMSRFDVQSWCPASTPRVVFGVTPNRAAFVNNYIRSAVLQKPDTRRFVDPSIYPLSPYWDVASGYDHMTAAGYALAGRDAANAFLGRVGFNVSPYINVDRTTGAGVIGGDLIPLGYQWLVNGPLGVIGPATITGTAMLGASVAQLSAQNFLAGSFTDPASGVGLGAVAAVVSNTVGAQDKGGTFVLGGRTGNGVDYYPFSAMMGAKLTAAGDANYAGYLAIYTTDAGGGVTKKGYWASGLVVGAPAGGDKGVGTANFAGDIYKNNTAFTNPDYVLEKYFTGTIEKFAENEGAQTYDGPVPLEQLRTSLNTNLRLPGITDEPAGAFERADRLLEKLEEAYIYILQLHERLSALEAE